MVIGGNELPVKKAQSRDVFSEAVEMGASVGQQINAIPLPLEFLHQIIDAIQRRDVLMPVVQDVPNRLVQALRQPGTHRRHRLRIGYDAPIHLDPLHRAKQLPADQRAILRVGDELGGIPLSIKVDEHTAHVEHNIFYHTMEPFLLLALDTTIGRMPQVTVRTDAGAAAVPTRSCASLVGPRSTMLLCSLRPFGGRAIGSFDRYLRPCQPTGADGPHSPQIRRYRSMAHTTRQAAAGAAPIAHPQQSQDMYGACLNPNSSSRHRRLPHILGGKHPTLGR